MKTLVTGGAGFIGSHLVERLLKDGHHVVVLDNFSTGRRENLVHLKNNKRLKLVECDISLNKSEIRNPKYETNPNDKSSKKIKAFKNSNFKIISNFPPRRQAGDIRYSNVECDISLNKSEIRNPKYETNPNDKSSKKIKAFKNSNFKIISNFPPRRQAGDIRYSNLVKYFRGIDWVFHLAALADIVPSIVNPLAYHQANVDGTVNVLEASRWVGVKKFIYAASGSCYGIPDKFPTSESAPIRVQYPYALTKYIGESYVLHWGKVYKLPVVSLRLFNVYGPRSRTSGTYGAVFGTFLAQKLAGKPFTVVRDGRQTRDFTFVTDVVEAMIAAVRSPVKNEIFNVGSGGSYSINELVKLLGGDVVYIPKRPGEPEKTLADIRKIKKTLSWYPMISFEKGVQILLDNIDYWRDAVVWTPKTIKNATREWFLYLH